MTSFLERPHVPLAIAGTVLVSLTTIVGSGFSPLALPFAVWSALPYGALWGAGHVLRNRWPLLGAGCAALAVELGVRGAVFLWPRGSTAAIALVFSPFYIGLIVMPVGAAVGWVFGKIWQSHLAGRLLVVVVSPILLGLLMLGFARPELFPTNIARRRAVLARVGPARVVAGGDAFESVRITTRPAWYVVGDIDGEPGEEVAVVDHAGADILNPETLQLKARVDFDAVPGTLWGSFSTLVRLPDGRIVVAQTGGGYSPTLIKALNGVELWAYRPDPKLPPSALRPADLDGDGRVEFYAAAAEFVSRLDVDGREVWRRPASLASLIAVLPQAADTPAWVVGLEYGRKVLVWSAQGQLLSERPATDDDSPLAAVDSFAGRSLIHGGTSARGYDLAGTLLFDVPLGDFKLAHALGARLVATRKPYLALLGSTDRDTSRWRLLVLDDNRQTVYDEIFDHYPRIMTARRADGSHALIVSSDRQLRVLRYLTG